MEYTYKMEEARAAIYDGEQVIATLDFTKDNNGYSIDSMHTDEEYQGKQLAKKLLYFFIEQTEGNKVTPICSYAVHVFSKDENLQKLTRDK